MTISGMRFVYVHLQQSIVNAKHPRYTTRTVVGFSAKMI